MDPIRVRVLRNEIADEEKRVGLGVCVCVVTVEWMDGAYEDENYSYLLTLIFFNYFLFSKIAERQ
jgi:hypothetical protein